jgi:elongator complex protein 3
MEDSQNTKTEAWYRARQQSPEKMTLARLALEDVRAGMDVFDAIRRHPLKSKGGGYVGKQMLVAAYRQLVESGEWQPDPDLLAHIRMKPRRTLSGVTVVTVLTKPYHCPGECIFCPTESSMPKSYVQGEPGAMRAQHHKFDPYDQVVARIEALDAVGHPTDKIELLVLGGTWSAYTRQYQEEFIKRLFEAMNGVDSASLEEAQIYNETAAHRSVGLTVETRPDHVNPEELAWMRRLGVTKVQMGAQSFDDRILELNKRGHTLNDTRVATALLRAAGFKIVLHWMPNLLGATLESDRLDFARMWEDFCPDEIKIYPTQLLENSELFTYWQRGEYNPYTTEELVDLIVDLKTTIPRYCRVNRVVRDIPSTDVVAGNKRTSLRMDIHQELGVRGARCQCVRCREVREGSVQLEELQMEDLVYQAGSAEEHFLSYNTPDDRLAGFLRLSLPGEDNPQTGLHALDSAAIIREVHVYGQSLEVGASQDGAAQHIGLGSKLIQTAGEKAREHGYHRMAVISAIGTRNYYRERGFNNAHLYLVKEL